MLTVVRQETVHRRGNPAGTARRITADSPPIRRASTATNRSSAKRRTITAATHISAARQTNPSQKDSSHDQSPRRRLPPSHRTCLPPRQRKPRRRERNPPQHSRCDRVTPTILAVLDFYQAVVPMFITTFGMQALSEVVNNLALTDTDLDRQRAARLIAHHGNDNVDGINQVLQSAAQANRVTQLIIAILNLYEILLPQLQHRSVCAASNRASSSSPSRRTRDPATLPRLRSARRLGRGAPSTPSTPSRPLTPAATTPRGRGCPSEPDDCSRSAPTAAQPKTCRPTTRRKRGSARPPARPSGCRTSTWSGPTATVLAAQPAATL